ncbi:MAG: lipoprotein [Bdellovibrionales bacterium]|nr:lipoprotein [Ramlibacter sp.]
MLHVYRILVSVIVLVACAAALSGCGQKGALYIPRDPGAADRATLPQIINSTLPFTSSDPKPGVPAPAAPAASTPSMAASAPAAK